MVAKCGNDLCLNPQHLERDIRSKRGDRQLVGQVFGYLTVIGSAANQRRKMWRCRCVCNVEKDVREDTLITGEARSCGCMRYELLVNNLTGRRFGKLSVVRRGEGGTRSGAFWLVRCDCGKEKTLTGPAASRQRSCGCTRKHGLCYTRTYRIWAGIKARCLNPNAGHYDNYGGRGIGICDRWKQSVEAFVADMGMCPSNKYSIDRIDPNGNYEPLNCRWATQEEQMNNTRTARVRIKQVMDAFRKRDPGLVAAIERTLLGKAG